MNETLAVLSPEAKVKRYLVPQELKAMVLDYYHDSAFGAHLGIAKMFRKISEFFIGRASGSMP
jgi:hypothetical protein